MPGEIIVDLFAGGGGASAGIAAALGRHPDIAVNHDATAIAVHAANHPGTHHECASVWHVEPRAACAGRLIGNSVCPAMAEAVVRANLDAGAAQIGAAA